MCRIHGVRRESSADPAALEHAKRRGAVIDRINLETRRIAGNPRQYRQKGARGLRRAVTPTARHDNEGGAEQPRTTRGDSANHVLIS